MSSTMQMSKELTGEKSPITAIWGHEANTMATEGEDRELHHSTPPCKVKGKKSLKINLSY